MTTPTEQMRELLVAGLYPHLVGKTVDMAGLHAAVDAMLEASAFTLLLDTAVAADENLAVFVDAIPDGEDPPEGADLTTYATKRALMRGSNGVYDETFLEP